MHWEPFRGAAGQGKGPNRPSTGDVDVEVDMAAGPAMALGGERRGGGHFTDRDSHCRDR